MNENRVSKYGEVYHSPNGCKSKNRVTILLAFIYILPNLSKDMRSSQMNYNSTQILVNYLRSGAIEITISLPVILLLLHCEYTRMHKNNFITEVHIIKCTKVKSSLVAT